MTCPLCEGDLVFLGRLGKLEHFRCRSCGMDCSTDVEESAGQDWACACGARGYEAAGAPSITKCPTCGRAFKEVSRG